MRPLNWVQWVTLILLASYAITTPLLFLRIQHVQHHQNDAIHSIICRAEHFVKTNKSVTAKQRRQALRFYNQSLADAHLPPCT